MKTISKLRLILGFLILATIAIIVPTTYMLLTNKKSSLTNLDDKSASKFFELSKNKKNIVVLYFDALNNSSGTNYLSSKKGKSLRTVMDDFTYYQNVLSFGAPTNLSIPTMFGGFDYSIIAKNATSQDQDVLWDDWISSAYANLMRAIGSANVDLYLNNMPYIGDPLTYWINDNKSIKKILKPKANIDPIVSNNVDLAKYKKFDIYNDLRDDYNVFDAYSKNLIAKETSKPKVLFNFSNQNHQDFALKNEDGQLVLVSDTDLSWNQAITKSSNQIYQQLERLFTRMKKLGVYDNSLIFIISDHGSVQLPDFSEEQHEHVSGAIDLSKINKIQKSFLDNKRIGTTFTRLVPTLAIKPWKKTNKSRQEFKFDNSTFLSLADFPSILLNYISQFKSDFPLFDWNMFSNKTNSPKNPLAINNQRVLETYVGSWINNPFFKIKMPNIYNMFKIKKNIYDLKNWRFSENMKKKYEDIK